jgi:hypothetical protein
LLPDRKCGIQESDFFASHLNHNTLQTSKASQHVATETPLLELNDISLNQRDSGNDPVPSYVIENSANETNVTRHFCD